MYRRCGNKGVRSHRSFRSWVGHAKHLRPAILAVKGELYLMDKSIDTDIPWAPAGFFQGVGNKGVFRTEVPPAGSRDRDIPHTFAPIPREGLRAKPPEADDIFSK